jgi:hypothetical protein
MPILAAIADLFWVVGGAIGAFVGARFVWSGDREALKKALSFQLEKASLSLSTIAFATALIVQFMDKDGKDGFLHQVTAVIEKLF